jgi:heat shock protein HtpX
MGLAHALEKIDAASAPTQAINRGSAHMCIADPLGRQTNLRADGSWSNMFASHPPMAARIAALKEMAFQR